MIAIKVIAAGITLTLLSAFLGVIVAGAIVSVNSAISHEPHALKLRGWPPYQVSACMYYPAWSDAGFACVPGKKN